MVSRPTKSAFLGTNQYIKSTFESMLNLKLGCPSRFQEQ
jgi:hypothetical protein